MILVGSPIYLSAVCRFRQFVGNPIRRFSPDIRREELGVAMTDKGSAQFWAGIAGIVSNSDVAVRFRGCDGELVDTTLRRLPVEEVLSGRPVREFRWWKGKRHYSGWYWSSTTGGHVVYESRLELARILLADQDRDVVSIAAQPFLLEGIDGDRVRKHIPDLLLGHVDGGFTVVDVKSADRVSDPKVAAQFAWTRSVCEAHGFGFEIWSGCDPVVLANVRFLAGYRRPALIALELIDTVLSAAAEPIEIGVLERSFARSAPPLVVRPVILHLLWRSWLSADLARNLCCSTVVSAVGMRAGVSA